MRKRKSRREYGTGTVSVNKTIGRYTVRWYETDGSMKSCSRFPLTAAGKVAAIEYLAKKNKESKNAANNTETETLGYWIIQYLKSKTEGSHPATNAARKRAALLVPETISEKKIDDIKSPAILNLYSNLIEQKKGITTIKNLHSILKLSINLAIVNHCASSNVVASIPKPRKPKKTKRKIEVVTAREIGSILLYVRKNKFWKDLHLFIKMLYYTGCRVGEMCALQWEDIDLEAREIHIQRTTSGQLGIVSGGTKTANGDRFIPIISNALLNTLKQIKNDSGYVFPAPEGNRPMRYHHIWLAWSKATAALMIHKNIHCLRHTFASNLIAKGISIPEVSRILGHSSPAVTLGIYSHALPRSNQSIIQLYNQKTINTDT